jgi:hypothetical protein
MPDVPPKPRPPANADVDATSSPTTAAHDIILVIKSLSFVDRARPSFPDHPDKLSDEMTAASAPRVDDAGIATMHTRKRAAQSIRIGRHQDGVDVVRHQAPGPHFDPVRGEQVAIKRMVG